MTNEVSHVVCVCVERGIGGGSETYVDETLSSLFSFGGKPVRPIGRLLPVANEVHKVILGA
jgi:hypothetical protein